MVEVSAEELAEPAGRTAEMPDQITVTSSSTDAAQLAGGTHAPVDGQDRAVTSIREQFNPGRRPPEHLAAVGLRLLATTHVAPARFRWHHGVQVLSHQEACHQRRDAEGRRRSRGSLELAAL